MPNPVILVSTAIYGTVVAEGIAQNHIETVILLGGFTAAVVGIVAWINNQIRSQIQDHAAADAQRHQLVLEKIEHLHELIERRENT